MSRCLSLRKFTFYYWNDCCHDFGAEKSLVVVLGVRSNRCSLYAGPSAFLDVLYPLKDTY